MRLDKYLAEAAVGTRKTVRNLIEEGKILVNNQRITNPALEIDELRDVITYLGAQIVSYGRVYYMFNKPNGCITATKDKDNKTVMDYFDDVMSKGLFPVGRLDKDTVGLLLITNDGEFSHSLMHPDKQIEKTYFFWAYGYLNEEKINKLKAGIAIGKGEDLARAVQIKVDKEGEYIELQKELDRLDHREIRINPKNQGVVSGYLTISEGRKHQVKRMLKGVGCFVVYLKRISIGKLSLDETLREGQYRVLSEKEIHLFYQNSVND